MPTTPTCAPIPFARVDTGHDEPGAHEIATPRLVRCARHGWASR